MSTTKVNLNGVMELDLVLGGTTTAVATSPGVTTVTNTPAVSGPTLETNGTTNSTQSVLNLVAGSNVTLSESAGSVTISSTGGGGGIIATPHDVTSSRVFGTVYQNTYGSLINIYGYGQITSGSGDSSISISFGPVSPPADTPWANTAAYTISGEAVGFALTVPENWYYVVNVVHDIASSPVSWWEIVISAAGGGTGLELETNGTPNGSQSLLNLQAGSNITITDGGTGTVTIASSGGGGYSLGGPVTTANITLGSGAGTGATITSAAGLDGNHTVTIQTGLSPAANATVYTLNFTTPRPNPTFPIVQSSFGSVYTSVNQLPYAISGITTSYEMLSNQVPLGPSQSFEFQISCP